MSKALDGTSFRIRKRGIFVAWRWEKDQVLINYCNEEAERGIIILDFISSNVWTKIINGKKIEEIIEDVIKDFEIPESEVRKNVKYLIDFFLQKELIERIDKNEKNVV